MKKITDESKDEVELVVTREAVINKSKNDVVDDGKFFYKLRPKNGTYGFVFGEDLLENKIYIKDLSENGKAEKAGIKVGDVVEKINGQQFHSMTALYKKLERSNNMTMLDIEISRIKSIKYGDIDRNMNINSKHIVGGILDDIVTRAITNSEDKTRNYEYDKIIIIDERLPECSRRHM